METTSVAIKAKEKIEAVFAKALQQKDFDILKDLLDDSGEFQISADKKIAFANKNEFINWLGLRRNEFKELTFHFDQCTYCNIGQPVVIFNDGMFPKVVKEISQKENFGFMIDVKDNKIKQTKLCYSFLQTENRGIIDIISARIKRFEVEFDSKSFDEGWIETGVDELCNTPANERMGIYSDRNKFIVVAEYKDRGYLLSPVPDMKEANRMINTAKGLLQEDPTQKAFLEAVAKKWKYAINNTNPIPESKENIDLGVLTCRIIALSPDYSQKDYINQRRAKK
jgi:hypothetical protein